MGQADNLNLPSTAEEHRFPQTPQVEAQAAPPAAERDSKQVFISHAYEDGDFAHRLADDLRKNGWRVWIAPESIRLGERWTEAIERGLRESDVFAIALTPAALQSDWVKHEVSAAIDLEKRKGIRCVPLVVESCDVPLLWNVYQWIQFQGNYRRGLTALLDMLETERLAKEKAERQVKLDKGKAEASQAGQDNEERKAEEKPPQRRPRRPWLAIGAVLIFVGALVAIPLIPPSLWQSYSVIPTPTYTLTFTFTLTAIPTLTSTATATPPPTAAATLVPVPLPTATASPTATLAPTKAPTTPTRPMLPTNTPTFAPSIAPPEQSGDTDHKQFPRSP